MVTFAIVAEAAADREIATALAERVFGEEAWIAENIESLVTWRGYRDGETFLDWHDVSTIAEQLSFRVHGRFEGGPVEAQARKALLILASIEPAIDGVALILDDDGQGKRVGVGFALALEWGFAIAAGVAVRERESWVLSGFVADGETETAALKRLRRELGFDPSVEPERLDAGGKRTGGGLAKRDPKRIVAILCPTKVREARCWTETGLDVLERNGAKNGLAEYLAAVRANLRPRIGS